MQIKIASGRRHFPVLRCWKLKQQEGRATRLFARCMRAALSRYHAGQKKSARVFYRHDAPVRRALLHLAKLHPGPFPGWPDEAASPSGPQPLPLAAVGCRPRRFSHLLHGPLHVLSAPRLALSLSRRLRGGVRRVAAAVRASPRHGSSDTGRRFRRDIGIGRRGLRRFGARE